MKNFKLDYVYSQSNIDKIVQEYDPESINIEDYEYGYENIGECFAVYKEIDENKVVSFVLTAASGKEYMWKCVYNDWL